MKVREIIKVIESDGWYLCRYKGTGHRQYRHPFKPGVVTVSGNLGQDVKRGTEHSVFKQAGLRKNR